ncbi:MAG: hypothetical protein KDJ28_14985 [Candidatus Competibacteraceae bacterium]|nr:hypothetical protein [Candidatus Competibacteraceae bacterium]
MATIELILRDDNNQIIGQRSYKKYALSFNNQTVHNIEGAVDEFKNLALSDIQLDLLEAAQNSFIQDKKKN